MRNITLEQIVVSLILMIIFFFTEINMDIFIDV